MTTLTSAAPAPAHPATAARLVGDTAALLRRSLTRLVRYPSMTVMLVAMPVVFLLLFVYVFGGTLGDGLPATQAGAGGAAGGKAAYLTYVVPGILVAALAAGGNGTAISIAMDLREGFVARLRTMAVRRASILGAHTLASVVQCLLCAVASFLVATLIGYRVAGGVGGALGALGVLALVALAITWLCVALGTVSDSVETASNLPMPLTFLPFLASGFVPTDSMPAGLRWFAEHQPFTPFIETVRALLDGTPLGSNLWLTLGWCAVIGVGASWWSVRSFDRSSTR
jgi:ABC-2 type transport system permease protein